jgi:hypothetical protein
MTIAAEIQPAYLMHEWGLDNAATVSFQIVSSSSFIVPLNSIESA